MKVLKNHTFYPPPVDSLRRGHRGSGLLIIAMVTAILVAVMSFSVTKLNQLAYQGFNNSKIMLQAQQYAESEAAIIKATNYLDLTAHSKTAIQNSNGYLSEITLSAESNYSDDIKQKTVSINVYRTGEALPRYSLNVLKTSVDLMQDTGGVPIGTIIAWISTTAPTEGGTWLLCNGQSCSAYPDLKTLIGNNVPNLNARFLEGTTGTPRTFKDAGLPNITGRLRRFTGWEGDYQPEGSFYFSANNGGHSPGSDDYSSPDFSFDASRSSAIYGKSTTVQPASYTVRYYIKAA